MVASECRTTDASCLAMEDEFTIEDLQVIQEIIIKYFGGLADIILNKINNYSVSAQAQIQLSRGVKEFRNFVHVVDTKIKKESAIFAANTYMT